MRIITAILIMVFFYQTTAAQSTKFYSEKNTNDSIFIGKDVKIYNNIGILWRFHQSNDSVVIPVKYRKKLEQSRKNFRFFPKSGDTLKIVYRSDCLHDSIIRKIELMNITRRDSVNYSGKWHRLKKQYLGQFIDSISRLYILQKGNDYCAVESHFLTKINHLDLDAIYRNEPRENLSYYNGIKLYSGAIFQNSFVGEAGLLFSHYQDGHSGGGYWGTFFGSEFYMSSNDLVVAPKVGFALRNIVGVALRTSLASYINTGNNNYDIRFTPEIGIAFYYFSIHYGYNFHLTGNRLPGISNNRVSINIVLDPIFTE